MLTDKQLEDRITVFQSCRREFERTIREELAEASDRAERLRRVLLDNGMQPEAPATPARLAIVPPPAALIQETLSNCIVRAINAHGGSATLDEVMGYLRTKTWWTHPLRSSVRSYIYTFIRNGVISDSAYKRERAANAA